MNTAEVKDRAKIFGIRLFLFSVFCIAIPVLLIWSTLVIRFTLPSSIGYLLSILFPLVSVLMLLLVKDLAKSLKIFGFSCLVIALYYFSISASNNRDWMDDVKEIPQITFSEREVTINNFRNFKYRSNQDFDIVYETRTYDLDKLEGCDFIISYWDGHRTVGHTFLSFRFENQPPISISVEVRKEKGESYHPVNGLFKQYELVYVIGDERDLISLRTHHRSEETFLYPLNLNKEESEAFLLSLLKGAQSLEKNPVFYHSLDQNCTTTLVKHVNDVPKFKVAMGINLLLNGLSDYAVYKMKGVSNELEFSTLKRSCYISKLAKTLKLDSNFSKNLRTAVNQKIQHELNQSH
ncbi:MAG: DUF4105 domain-containing protein [Lentisphaeraceae bacterium]|nr:DUF4105 domain-containing protein [Lentisphaeraceae bacterium]